MFIVENTSTSPLFETVNGNKAHAYGVFISQLVRFTTINDNVNNFLKYTKNMVQKLITREFKKHVLKISTLEHAMNMVGI